MRVVFDFLHLDIVPSLYKVSSHVSGRWSAHTSTDVVPRNPGSAAAIDGVLEGRMHVTHVLANKDALVFADPVFG